MTLKNRIAGERLSVAATAFEAFDTLRTLGAFDPFDPLGTFGTAAMRLQAGFEAGAEAGPARHRGQAGRCDGRLAVLRRLVACGSLNGAGAEQGGEEEDSVGWIPHGVLISLYWERSIARSSCPLFTQPPQVVSCCFAAIGGSVVTGNMAHPRIPSGWGGEVGEDAKQRILVVDDDAALRELVADYLGASGFQVEGVGDGAAFRASLARQAADLVVLDLMLPGEDGLSLLKWLRAAGGPPVIIVSARGEEVDRVVGLELGADDYLAKPFGPRELLARVRAVLRRGAADRASSESGAASNVMSFGPYRLDLATHVLTCDGREITLTSGEFILLRLFLEHPNQVLSRDHLITLVKGYERAPFDRSVDVRVTRLRRKIEPNPDAPIYLRTIWGEGYLFSPRGEGAA